MKEPSIIKCLDTFAASLMLKEPLTDITESTIESSDNVVITLLQIDKLVADYIAIDCKADAEARFNAWEEEVHSLLYNIKKY